jgi:hypothetical protein
MRSQRGDTKTGKMFDDVNNLMVLIQVNQVERKQYAHGVDSTRRDDPESFIDSQLKSSNQPSQARKGRIRRSNTEAEEAFARLVVDAVCTNIHFFTLGRAVIFVSIRLEFEEPTQLLSYRSL